jgi:hypothetical protein
VSDSTGHGDGAAGVKLIKFQTETLPERVPPRNADDDVALTGLRSERKRSTATRGSRGLAASPTGVAMLNVLQPQHLGIPQACRADTVTLNG